MGNRLVSLKGNKATWSGVSRLTTSDRGRRRFTTLDNCYVSQDGEELRAFPGYATFLDLTDANNTEGFGRYVPDVVRPVLEYSSPNEPYRYTNIYSTPTSQSLECRAKITHPFAFEQIGNEIVILGESRFREAPFFDSTRARILVTAVTLTGSNFILTMSAAMAGNSSYDDGAGLNGLYAEPVVYVDYITLSGGTEADQDLVNNQLAGRFHEVDIAAAGTSLQLKTTISGAFSTTPIAADGEVHATRSNRNASYPTSGPATNTPYAGTYDDRPDDPDALTSWRVTDAVDLGDSTKSGVYPCYPAWVANRQRDQGDGVDGASTFFPTEGLYTVGAANVRGVSRREQRRLPFRPNVETALDRIILAVPQYGCMFQVPMRVPTDPSNWKAGGTSDAGIVYPNNSIYDKPRALGIPKPRLIESTSATPGQISPNDIGTSGQYDSSISARAGSPQYGLDAGTYTVAIAFEDAGTGDEGLASEPIEVTIPANSYSNYAYTLRLNYIHPGYHFPECLAFKINVYIAPPNTTALAFYGQFELADNPVDATPQGKDPYAGISSVYGLGVTLPADPSALVRSFDLPLLDEGGDLSGSLDATRLAPQSATMPRGANACKFVRGVLFSGGSMGNAGPNDQLWQAKATARWDPGNPLYKEDEFDIRAHSLDDANAPSTGAQDGNTEDVTLGIAGRCFPDAYQGIDVISTEMFPGGDSIKKTDRVLNRKVNSLYGLEAPSSAGNFYFHHSDRIRLQRDAFDRSRVAGAAPTTYSGINLPEKSIYYVMPRGQMQIGDPGAPHRSSRAFIKIIDPSKGDDLQAFGHLNGSVIACTRKETYTYSWYRNPAGEEPNLLSNEYGCIASNSMVEFDGGLAWLSERGPVALGQGIQHVGADVAEDFYSQNNRYMTDSRGMMRHSWGVHDSQRGIVMWGLLRRDSSSAPRSLTISYEGSDYTTSSAGLSDKILSRFPCDEVLIWSYRANAFSHWRPPAGLEVYWMRPLRDADGRVRMCFLAADNRIYALDDAWSDRNAVSNGGLGADSVLGATAPIAGDAVTAMYITATSVHQDGDTSDPLGRNFSLLLAPGMVVEFLDSKNNVTAVTSIQSVTSSNQTLSSAVIELAAAQTWVKGTTLRIGVRQTMKIVSTFIGQETMDTMDVEKIQMRYSTEGAGFANARVKAFCNEFGSLDGEQAKSIDFTTNGLWEPLGAPKANTSIPAEITALGRRINFGRGRISAPEIAVQVEISGETQVRIQDLSLEVG
tara:strand:- start:16968 stop:20699 length:3732 start_codon:yes stop_codon:yes gene_type:complete